MRKFKEGERESEHYVWTVDRAPVIIAFIVAIVITGLLFDISFEEYQPSFNFGIFDRLGMVYGMVVYLFLIFIPMLFGVAIVKDGKVYFAKNRKVIAKYTIAGLQEEKKRIDEKIVDWEKELKET